MVETSTAPTQKIPYVSMGMGSDPEFFFHKKTLLGKMGTVIGAEKVIPKEGIRGGTPGARELNTTTKIIIDGVQAEMNPSSATCRQVMGGEISRMMHLIVKIAKDKGVAINWKPLVKVTASELKSLKPENKKFGCEPSYNAYKEVIELPDPEKYLYRAAGGHLHFGHYGTPRADHKDDMSRVFKNDPKETIKILDIIVGNTCVMIDKDEGNIERRKFYGRAGEYRLPMHGPNQGLEYRTLSNFWLRNYKMMSMVFGFARMAMGFALLNQAKKELFEAVKEEDIQKAINENDAVLAKKNFKKIKPIIEKYSTDEHSLNRINMRNFEFFVDKGIDFFFKDDVITSWTNNHFSTGGGQGWESFMAGEINTMRKQEKWKTTKKS
jgi:hypothetical protein